MDQASSNNFIRELHRRASGNEEQKVTRPKSLEEAQALVGGYGVKMG